MPTIKRCLGIEKGAIKMKKYTVKMLNPKSGKTESYNTEAESKSILEMCLDVFRSGGYEILEIRER